MKRCSTCGQEIEMIDEPLRQLLSHCFRQLQSQQGRLSNVSEIDRENDNPRTITFIQRCEIQVHKWQSWVDALEEVIKAKGSTP